MESLRSVLLLGLILVFVAVKGEYPTDYDCEDFRQAKREKSKYRLLFTALLFSLILKLKTKLYIISKCSKEFKVI